MQKISCVGTEKYHSLDHIGTQGYQTEEAIMGVITEARPTRESGGFHQSWFPLALSSEVVEGQVIGREFLGTRVVLYRNKAGMIVVQSAYCPHLGADLAVGQVIDGRIRCAFHHWSFDGAGLCVHIPTGDKIPPGARIFAYPSAETLGLVWAFNGEQPLFAPPEMPGAAAEELECRAYFRTVRPLDPWVGTSNGVDFQHLRSLHNIPAIDPEMLEVGRYGLEYRIEAPGFLQHGCITGTNTFAQRLSIASNDQFMLFTGSPMARGKTASFYAIAVRRAASDAPEAQAAVAANLDALKAFVDKVAAEDAPVLSTIRFRNGVLTASDRHLARFFKFVDSFPCADPPDA
jgi:phenylpropionate dioxygenase-like ring-hydroxylating dioxygenase large terminal subunit